MKHFPIPDYTDDDLKRFFSPEDCVEILEHMGYRIKDKGANSKMDRLLDHLSKYNKMFVNEIKRIIVEGNHKSKERRENIAYTFLENFYRIPGLPFGYYLASDGICVFGPMFQNSHVKIVYNSQNTWNAIEENFPAFREYIKEKKINYSLLKYKDKEQNCEWMQNEFALAPILNQICISIGLTMYYYSQQGMDPELSDKTCVQMINEDVETINHFWN